jgi:hypothetical protein
MASRFLLAAVLAAVPLGGLTAQQGWQVQTDSDGFEKPSTSLVAMSTDRSTQLELTCIETPMRRDSHSWVEYLPWIGLTLDSHLGFFDFSGEGFVLIRARFLPDSTIENTSWKSQAASGHGNMIVAEWVRDHPDYVARELHGNTNAMEEGLLTKLRRADTLQAKLDLYGRSSLVVRFPIRNHGVLEQFLTKCTVAPEP